MVQESIKIALKNFGLTEKEIEVYLFLGKKGAQKIGQIAKQLKMNKGLIYRLLKKLQKKGVVEATLESPTRYTAIPFEEIINSYVKSKREEAERIEEAKDSLLSDWNRISQEEVDSTLEKFGVIEGTKKVYNKISQLIEETHNKIYLIVSVCDLSKLEQFGVLEQLNNTISKSKIKCRILTQISNSSIKATKLLKTKMVPEIILRGTSLSLGTPKFSRMIIRDDEELLLYISDNKDKTSKKTRETCLLTNSNAIIQAFNGLFQDLWNSSSDIEKRISELESGKAPSIMELIKDNEIAKKRYCEALNNGKNEILIITSSERLIQISKRINLLEKWYNKGVTIKILAPITTENLEATQTLLPFSEVRHIPIGYRETTIIDDNKLFQFNNSSLDGRGSSELWNYNNILFTNNLNYIAETKKIIFDIWKKTHTPQLETVRDLSRNITNSQNKQMSLEKTTLFMQGMEYEPSSRISEEAVLKKIEQEQNKYHKKSKDWSSTLKYFGNRAFAAIKPPKEFSLPDMIIVLFNITEKSSFGAEKWIVVNLLDEKTRNPKYVPVAFVQNNPEMLKFRKKVFEGFPLVENMHAFNNEQVQMQIKGNTFVAGWTRPIPLGDKYEPLPPSYLLFEGYGDVKSGMFTNITLSGRKQEVWYNSYDSFVNMYHPKSKYMGAGTEAFIEKNTLFISHPPNRKK